MGYFSTFADKVAIKCYKGKEADSVIVAEEANINKIPYYWLGGIIKRRRMRMSEVKVGDIGAGFEEFLVRTGGKGRPTQLIRWTDENGVKQEMKKRLWLKTAAGKPYDVVVKATDESPVV